MAVAKVVPFCFATSLLWEALLDACPEVVIWVIVAPIHGNVEFLHLSEGKRVVVRQLSRIHCLPHTRSPRFGVSCDVKILWVMDEQVIVKIGFKSNSERTVLQWVKSELFGYVESVYSAQKRVGEIFNPRVFYCCWKKTKAKIHTLRNLWLIICVFFNAICDGLVLVLRLPADRFYK